MQSTGRVGKSTFAEGLISWLKYAKIPFCAMDGDRQHRTLSRRHPDYVDEFDAAGSFDDFSDLIKALPDNPVVIVDFPANHTDFLLYIDLDNFKLINDFLGHLAGDKVLTEIATVIKESVRSHDVAFRLGGDEFAILLRDLTFPEVHAVAERIRSPSRQSETGARREGGAPFDRFCRTSRPI